MPLRGESCSFLPENLQADSEVLRICVDSRDLFERLRVFQGRQVAGIRPGVELTAEGMVGDHKGRLAILNPIYELAPQD